jgi:hypothetical protein
MPCNTLGSIRDIILCFVCRDWKGWYEAVTSAYLCTVHHVVKGIVVNTLAYFTPAVTIITNICWPPAMYVCDVRHFGSGISVLYGIVDCAVVSLLQVVQSIGRNPLASSHVRLNAVGCDGSVRNSTWRTACSGPLFRWLGSNTTDCGACRTVTGSILSYHWCEY